MTEPAPAPRTSSQRKWRNFLLSPSYQLKFVFFPGLVALALGFFLNELFYLKVAGRIDVLLAQLQLTQPVEISIDAYPGHSFTGEVASIGAGTGAEFSLLPAQNATGNWVKVVQRVPVRISFDDAVDLRLRSGLSASVSVDLRNGPGSAAAAE